MVTAIVHRTNRWGDKFWFQRRETENLNEKSVSYINPRLRTRKGNTLRGQTKYFKKVNRIGYGNFPMRQKKYKRKAVIIKARNFTHKAFKYQRNNNNIDNESETK